MTKPEGLCESQKENEDISLFNNTNNSNTTQAATDKDLCSHKLEDSRDSHFEKHEDSYTELLQTYVCNTRLGLKQKRFFKLVFFIVSCFILVVTIFSSAFFVYLALSNDGTFFEKTLQSIPGLVTFVTALMVIPNTISIYLFNPDEERNTIETISKIIDRDDRYYSIRDSKKQYQKSTKE